MPAALIGGTWTHWREWGGGVRRALLVHCSLGQAGAWTGVAERLADSLHMQAFDMPGHGRSGPWDQTRDFMDQTLGMTEGLAGQGPLDLIGHSFGAVVCLRLALEHPERVRSLVLFEPVLLAAAARRGNGAAAAAPVPATLPLDDPELAARRFTEVWGTGEPWDALPERQRRALAERIRLIPAGDPALREDRAGLLAPGRLESLAVPVLLLEGSASPPVVGAINAALAGRLPEARRAKVAGAGHMGPITHPAEVAAAIRDHLRL